MLTIAAGLFVLGFFVMVNANLQRLVRSWTDAAELAVYLRDDVPPPQVSALKDMIDQQRPRVLAAVRLERRRTP